MTSLKELMDLHRLKGLVEETDTGYNINKLESEFLTFSTFSPRVLKVRKPSMYKLQDDEVKHYLSALHALGIKIDETTLPETVDISGAYEQRARINDIIILSMQQLNADHLITTKSYLNPLLEKIYGEGTNIIKDFAIHEALIGNVKAFRGDLNLEELTRFPERFTKGKYSLKVSIDTPSKTIKRYVELMNTLIGDQIDPKEFMLDKQKIEDTISKGIDLRKMLGALSRYCTPETLDFQVQTNSCIIETEENTQFFLYSDKTRKNWLIYFGKPVFEETDQTPYHLTVLDGKERQHTLAKLVQVGIYDLSLPVLSQHIEELQTSYDNAVKAGPKGNGNHVDFKKFLEGLKEAEQHLKCVVNQDVRREYATKIAPELLEFMVYPNSQDPIIHELLPRLSWNKSIQLYHNTPGFIQRFESSNEEQRKALLQEISSNMMFRNQQNNNTNQWLYANYKSLCVNEGLEFQII